MIKRFFKKERYAVIFLLMFALIFVRYCCYGFEYWYQLDDYIQYHNYTVNGASWNIVMSLGMLAARPLAGIADVFVWSKFFPVMLLGVAVVSAMFAASACFFRWCFERHFKTGYLFLVVYALLPLGLEGTYWMSASTRIVTGLFLASLSLYFFELWCDKGGARFAIAYGVVQLVSFGFYEQMIPLSIAAVVLSALLNLKHARKRGIAALWSIAAAGLYFLFVSRFPDSLLYGAKTEYVLPNTPYYFNTFLPRALGQFKSAFLGGGFYTLTRGFWRGVKLIVADGLWLYLLAVILLSAAMFFAARRFSTVHVKKPIAAIVVGVLLILAPLSPFFVAASTWFSFRGTVASFCGIALVADTVLVLLLSHCKKKREIIAAVSAVLTLWCCICAVSEIHDYKETTQKDRSVVYMIEEKLSADGNTDGELDIGILNLEPTYLEEQNSYYHEHIHGVTESDWALSGALSWHMGPGAPDITPIRAGIMFSDWNRDAMLLSNFDVLYLYDGEDTLTKVTAENTGGESYTIRNDRGDTVAVSWEEDGNGYLELMSD